MTMSFINGFYNQYLKPDSIQPFDPTDSAELYARWAHLCTDDEFCQVVFNRGARLRHFVVLEPQDGIPPEKRERG